MNEVAAIAAARPIAAIAVAPIVILDSCTACGACLLTCPESALLPSPIRPVVVGASCTSCGECIEICPRGAIVEAICA